MSKQNPVLFPAKNRHGVDWQKSLTIHNHPVAEVLSAVIKEIRRGNEEKSLYWALEMATTCREAEEFLWECLIVCVPEDIGLANPEAISVVTGLKDGYFLIPKGDRRRFVFLAQAVAYMARSCKSRYVSEMLGDVLARIELGQMNLEMPDYAVDIHTKRGKALGRGELHYLTDASQLANKDERFHGQYLERLIARASRA